MTTSPDRASVRALERIMQEGAPRAAKMMRDVEVAAAGGSASAVKALRSLSFVAHRLKPPRGKMLPVIMSVQNPDTVDVIMHLLGSKVRSDLYPESLLLYVDDRRGDDGAETIVLDTRTMRFYVGNWKEVGDYLGYDVEGATREEIGAFKQNPAPGFQRASNRSLMKAFPEAPKEKVKELEKLLRWEEASGGYSSLMHTMAIADELLGGHGVEEIPDNTSRLRHIGNRNLAAYINMGDVYAVTLLYDYGSDRFFVTTYGDWIEDYEARHGREHLGEGFEENPRRLARPSVRVLKAAFGLETQDSVRLMRKLLDAEEPDSEGVRPTQMTRDLSIAMSVANAMISNAMWLQQGKLSDGGIASVYAPLPGSTELGKELGTRIIRGPDEVTLIWDKERGVFFVATLNDWLEQRGYERQRQVNENRRPHPFATVEAHRGMLGKVADEQTRQRMRTRRYAVAGIDRKGNDWSLGEFVGFDEAVERADRQQQYPEAAVIDLLSGQVVYQPGLNARELAANPDVWDD